jgi:hypothetical protein
MITKPNLLSISPPIAETSSSFRCEEQQQQQQQERKVIEINNEEEDNKEKEKKRREEDESYFLYYKSSEYPYTAGIQARQTEDQKRYYQSLHKKNKLFAYKSNWN